MERRNLYAEILFPRRLTLIELGFNLEPGGLRVYRLKPRVVTLCGSTKYKQAFIDANFTETMAGRIVLSVGGFGQVDGISLTDEEKQMLGSLHKRKIDISDEILVLNVGGFIGESTRSEIEYARLHGKGVRFLETAADKSPDSTSATC